MGHWTPTGVEPKDYDDDDDDSQILKMFGTVDIRVQLAGQKVPGVLPRQLDVVGSRLYPVDFILGRECLGVMQCIARVGHIALFSRLHHWNKCK